MKSYQDLLQDRVHLINEQEALVNGALAAGRTMTAEEQTQFQAKQTEIDALTATIDALEKSHAQVTALNQPGPEPWRPAGTAAQGAHTQRPVLDDGGFKSLGELVCALRFGDPRGRVHNLRTNPGEAGGVEVPEAFRADLMPRIRNEWTAGTGAEGGFILPAQRSNEILMIRPEGAIVRPRAQVIPPGEPPDGSISFPAFSQGAKGVYGGVQVYWTGEGKEMTETSGGLEEVTLEPKEVSGFSVVTDKLLRNWAAATTFISNLLRGAVNSVEDYVFLRGDGVAKPYGIINCPGVLTVNRGGANAIGYADVVGMLAKLLPESVGRAVWVACQSVLPQIATLQDPEGHYIFIGGDATRGIPATLAGIPILFTGKTPPLGQKGDLMLVDFSYYLIKDGSGPYLAASEHVYFKQNKTVVKIVWNVHGAGWVKAPLTLENGVDQASPYVVLDVPA